MKHYTRVRAVIVNFNAGELLQDCVRRVAGSTLPVDIMVIDNASTDGSAAVLQADAESLATLDIRSNETNRGFACACNQGLAGWTGEYALLLNPDCLIEPDTIERMLAVLDAAPRAGMAGCLLLGPDGEEQAGCRRSTPLAGRALRLALGGRGFNLDDRPLPAGPEPVEAISGAFMLVRTKAVAEVGLLDEGYFMHCEDLDWCMRFRLADWDILFVPDVRVSHIKGACSATHPIRVEWHKHRGMLRYYRKFFRGRYPRLLNWLIPPAVWVRFGLRSAALTLSKWGGRK